MVVLLLVTGRTSANWQHTKRCLLCIDTRVIISISVTDPEHIAATAGRLIAQHLDEDMQTIGVPSDVPSVTNSSGRYFFAVLANSSALSTLTTSSSTSSASSLPQVSSLS